ncbi:hypothetical protein Tco_1183090 [Tanacetum coccineum]
MADENVPTPAPTRSDDQILLFAAWVPIRKSNYVWIFKRSKRIQSFRFLWIFYNFIRAFTASTSVPAIYIQQFWNTLTYEAKTGVYSFELDEARFVLDANLLRKALEITPIDQAHQFVSPPSGEAIMDFVNELGYTEVIHFVSRMAVNNLSQPWRAILSMINQCLTGKTSGHDRPRYPVLQMLWGIITSSNVDYAELMWEEFVQAIQTFLTDKANLGSPTKKGRKDKAHVIPYCRFTKLIICHLGRIHNIHQRSTSPFHLAEEDLRLGNLKFVPKGEEDEHNQKVTAEKEGKKKSASTKQPKPKPAIKKSSKLAPAPKPKLVDEPDEEPAAHSEPEPEPEPEPVHQGEGEEFDMERAIQMSLESFQAQKGKGKAIVTEEQDAQSLLALHTPKRRSTTDQFILQRWTPTTEEASTGPSAQPLDDTYANIVRNSPSSADAETGARSYKTNRGGDTEILQITEELGEDVDKQENIEEKTVELDQDQAGSDPTHESQPLSEQVLIDEDQAGPDPGISRVALAGPDLEPTHDEFMADLYLKVQKSLKFSADEHVILEDPLRKLNVEAEVVFMVTVPIYQASSSVLPLSTPLVEHVTALKKKLFDLEQNKKNLDNTTRNLRSRVYTLELRDLPHKINEAVCENVKEAVKIALQAPLRDRFRDLSKEDMKEMLHQRMFESGTYKSLPGHIALYEALEASMARAQRGEFLAEKDKSRKRRRDDQDPPPLPDSNLSKRRRHDTGSYVEDIPIPDYANISDSEDTDSAHLLKIKQRPEWLKPIPDDERPATPEPAWVIPTSYIPDAVNNWANALATTYQAPTENSLLKKTKDMRTFMNWYCQKMGKIELTQADFEGQAYKVVKPFYPDVVHLQFQMEECHKMLTDQIDWANPEGDQVRIDISKPPPLSGPPGHVTIQTQFFFNKDLDYLRYGNKGSRQALLISKMKAARYLDFGLELLVPEHMWINKVCTYDIIASYGISHWWFNRQKFYIDRHTVDSSRKVVRTHMSILSVVRIKAYSRYGYDYLKEITLRRADYQEYMIAEKDFKNLYPSDFEDLNLLFLQGHLNHLPGSEKRMISTSVNLWTRNLVTRQRVEDF